MANNSPKISQLHGFELKQRSAAFFARIYCRYNHNTVQKNALFTHQKIIFSPRPRESLRCPRRHFGKVPINATNLHHSPIEPSISELRSTSARSGIFSNMLRKSVQPHNAEPRSFAFSYNSFQHCRCNLCYRFTLAWLLNDNTYGRFRSSHESRIRVSLIIRNVS